MREGRKEGRKEGSREGRTEGRKEGMPEGRTDGRKEGRKEGRKAANLDPSQMASIQAIIGSSPKAAQTAPKPNSSNHKPEWAQFMSQYKSRSGDQMVRPGG